MLHNETDFQFTTKKVMHLAGLNPNPDTIGGQIATFVSKKIFDAATRDWKNQGIEVDHRQPDYRDLITLIQQCGELVFTLM